MTTYVLAYSGGSMPETPEAQAAVMAAWREWFGTLGEAVVDGGNPFGASATVGAGGATSPGSSAGLTGYSIVRADDLDAATATAKGCPVLAGGGEVHVYEIVEVM